MMLRERFVLTYAATIFVIAVLLSALQLHGLDVQFSAYAIEFLLLTEFLAFQRSFSRILMPVAIALLMGFFYIIAQRVIQIIVGT